MRRYTVSSSEARQSQMLCGLARRRGDFSNSFADDGLRLELLVECKRVASAGAGADMLDVMEHELGIDRQGVSAKHTLCP